MKHLTVVFTLLVILLAVLIAVPPSFASATEVPFNFNTSAAQTNPNTGMFFSVPLAPGLDPLLNPSNLIPPFVLVFGSNIPIGITTTFSAEFILAGQASTFGPFTDFCRPDSGGCVETYGFTVPVSYKVINGTLAVTENGVTEVDNFRFESFTPEPPTAVLMGIGFLIMFWRLKLWRSWQS